MSKPNASNRKKIIVAINSIEEAFENSLFHKDSNIVYIKTSLLSEWVTNKGDGFVSKTFGDKNIDMFLTFIYKDGDKEFKRDNLENKILDFKLCRLLNQEEK